MREDSRCAVLWVHHLRIRTKFEKASNDLFMLVICRNHQRRGAIMRGYANVGTALVDQAPHHIQVSVLDCDV